MEDLRAIRQEVANSLANLESQATAPGSDDPEVAAAATKEKALKDQHEKIDELEAELGAKGTCFMAKCKKEKATLQDKIRAAREEVCATHHPHCVRA